MRSFLGYALYNLMLVGSLVALAPIWLAWLLVSPRWRVGLGERLGFMPPEAVARRSPRKLWVHAASVGEVGVAKAVLDELLPLVPDAEVVLSTVTETGLELARRLFRGRVVCVHAPLDLPWCAGRAMKQAAPNLYLVIETELWPNAVRSARRSGAKVVLANGRLSERLMPRYRKLRVVFRPVLEQFETLLMTSEADAERVRLLGAPPERVRVTGNCKWDRLIADSYPAAREEVRRLLDLSNEPVFVAGSTRDGEEEHVIRAFREMANLVPGLVMVIAPRHPKRFPAVQKMLRNNGIVCDMRTGLTRARRRSQVVLLDSVGELFRFYSVADVAFCGGSLIAAGGQNLMEPAAWGVVVLHGPSMYNFAEAERLLRDAGAAVRVNDSTGLVREAVRLLRDPKGRRERGARGRLALEKAVGASRRTAETVAGYLR